MKLSFLRMFSYYLRVIEKILLFLKFEKNIVLKLLSRFYRIKHKLVKKIIRKDLKLVISNIATYKGHTNRITNNLTDPVWVMWWQNEQPFLVSTNIKRLKEKCGNNLVIITKNNFFDYIEVDQELKKFINSENLSLTLLSDFVRAALLYHYGGLWIDSTIYITDNFSIESVRNGKDFFTCTNPNQNYSKFVSNDLWTGYFMGGSKNKLYFLLLLEGIRYYLLNNKKNPDYFTIDYILSICFDDNIGGFKENVNGLKNKNKNVLSLSDKMNLKFDQKIWNNLKTDTYIFKLTYKKNFLTSKDGKETFYSYLYKANENNFEDSYGQ